MQPENESLQPSVTQRNRKPGRRFFSDHVETLTQMLVNNEPVLNKKQ